MTDDTKPFSVSQLRTQLAAELKAKRAAMHAQVDAIFDRIERQQAAELERMDLLLDGRKPN